MAQTVRVCLRYRRPGFNLWVRKIFGEGNDNPSVILAWRIPWTEEPSGLQSKGLQRAGHRWATNPFTVSWCCLYKRTSWGIGLRQESATAETESPLQEGRGCRGKGCENTLPLMVGLPCVCLAKLYSCKQVRVYMWGANPKEWREQGEVQQVPWRWDHRVSSRYQILIIKRNYQEVILSCQTPSKNNRSCLTSVTEPAHLVPLTEHIHSYPLTLSTHFGKIIRRVS